MWNLEHIDTFEGLCQRTLSFLRDELSAQRCLFMYQEKEGEELVVEVAHGIERETVWTTAEISQELLRSVRREGKPIVLLDAGQDPKFGNRTSVVLSNLRSILCVPVFHPSRLVVGLLYADNRIQAGAFNDKHLSMAVEYAVALEKQLFELRKLGADISPRAAAPEPGPPEPALEAEPNPEENYPVNDDAPDLSKAKPAVPPPMTEDEDVLKKFT